MDHNRNAELLCSLVNGEKLIVVGVEVLVGGIELEAFYPQFGNTSLQFRHLVEGDVGVDICEGDKPFAPSAELSHPVIDANASDHGINLREGYDVIDPLFIHELEQAFGRGQNGPELRQTPFAMEPPHPVQKPLVVFIRRGDVEVKIYNQHDRFPQFKGPIAIPSPVEELIQKSLPNPFELKIGGSSYLYQEFPWVRGKSPIRPKHAQHFRHCASAIERREITGKDRG